MTSNALNSLSAFFASTTITIPSTGAVQRVNKTGSFFYCKEAAARFQMRFNNGEWFEFDQSFYFDLGADIYEFVEFKALAGATADQDILFYTASREVGAHLNVVRDPFDVMTFQYQVARTIVKGWTGSSIAASTAVTFYGTGGSGVGQAGAAYAYRKAIVVTNNDASSVLEIWDGTGTNRVGTVQPLKAWYLETSDNLQVKNETLSPINCRVSEIFYPAA